MPSIPDLPHRFETTILSTWGDNGRAWLESLPRLIEVVAQRWKLTVRAPLPSLSYSYAASVVTADGKEAVLKLGVPNPELRTEIAALQAFADGPVVRLLEADAQRGALLLRRLRPGRPLSEMLDDEAATLIAARLVRDVPVPVPRHHAFPSVEGWARAFDRLRARFDGATGPVPRGMVEKAERLLEDLRGSCSRDRLLHGDLHHDNILFDQRKGWVAIDPKGITGDPAYEAARLQHNPIPGFLGMGPPRAVAMRRVEILSEILREDAVRLLGWAFFDAVLAACWSIEEDGRRLQYHLRCAEVFDDLVS